MGRIKNLSPKKYTKKIVYGLCVGSTVLMMILTGCGNQSADVGSEDSTKKVSETVEEKSEAKKDDMENSAEIPSDLLPSDGDGLEVDESSTKNDATNDATSDTAGETAKTSKNTFDAGGGTSSKSSGSSSSKKGTTDSSSNQGNSSSQGTIRVTMSVNGSAAEDQAVSMGAVPITIETGSSVYDVLVASGVSFSGGSGYVSGIGGLFEKDCGPKSGWTYAVNGKTPGKGCGSYKVNNGDSIQWIYVLSY